MDDDVELVLHNKTDPLYLGTVPNDVTFLDLTTKHCRCQLPWGLGAILPDENKMRIFGTSGRGLLNSGFIPQNITEPFEKFLPRHFWNHQEWDVGFYQFLFNTNIEVASHGTIRDTLLGSYCFPEPSFSGFRDIPTTHSSWIQGREENDEESKLLNIYVDELNAEAEKLKAEEDALIQAPQKTHTDGANDNPYEDNMKINDEELTKLLDEIDAEIPESERKTTEHGFGFKLD